MNPSLPQVRYCCETCGQPVDHARDDGPVAYEGVELAGKLLRYNGQSRKLGRSDAAVLRSLMLNGRRSTEALIMLTGSDSDIADECLRVYISHNRRALEAIDAPFTIENVWGWGYRLASIP